MMRLDKGVGGERSEEPGPVVPPCSPGVHSKELKGFFCRLLQQQHFVAKMLQGTRQSWETLKGKSEEKKKRREKRLVLSWWFFTAALCWEAP